MLRRTLWCSLFMCVCEAYFNLFITEEEVRRLLGLSAELYYVRQGVVNTYAMNFVVPIPANITDLEFSWQALTKNPLPYAWGVEYNNRLVMLEPQFNISKHGYISNKIQSFRIRFPCTGIRSAEVKVRMQLNVTSSNKLHNHTFLSFRRNKICLEGLPPIEELIPRNDSVRLDPGSLISTGGTFYIAVGCACVTILIVFTVVSIGYMRSSKTNTPESIHTSYTSNAYVGNPNVFIRMDSIGSGSYATIASFQKAPLDMGPSPYATSYVTSSGGGKFSHHIYSKPVASTRCASKVSYYASSQLLQLPQLETSERIRRLAVPRHTISTRTLIHEGTFGRVYKGIFQSDFDHVSHEILIKTVSVEASKCQVSLLLAEGTMMYGLTHKNILTILAANADNLLPPILVYPYINKGNLKRFLYNCRTRGGEQYTLVTQDLVDMAMQIVSACVFLHNNAICHKDLSSRNCVVDEKLRVKVTDSALSRDLFPTDYHCLGDNENRPIRWMALESLVHRVFSLQSDVWSFGVVLWELITLAQQPYSEIDPFEMAEFLRDGYRLAQPITCPDDLYGLMTCCWLANPEERPTFIQLRECLEDFSTALGSFI